MKKISNMQAILNYIKKPSLAIYTIIIHTPRLWPDRFFLRIKFRQLMGYRLDLKTPKTFSEKLQWLKLYDRRPEYTQMVDKYAVKEYVAGVIGKEYIIPTIGVWNNTDEIEWDKLPAKFVLKCTHDSGSVVICHDKSKIDKKAAIDKLSQSLRNNYYYLHREWPYKHVKRRIIAETYLEMPIDSNDLIDYKFFCFNGEPKYCQVISGRNETMSIDFFDHEWRHQPFHEPYFYPFAKVEPVKPQNYDTMWEMARKLARNKPFSRIDFYNINGQIYFGEITFFPTSGMGGFDPKEWDYIFGNMITLPDKK